MTTLEHVLGKFNLDPVAKYDGVMPLNLPHFSRGDLAKLFAELGFKRGAEVGVETGKYSEALASTNPQATIYLVDAWQRYGAYREHVSQGKLEGFYLRTLERVQQYGNCVPRRKFSMDAVRDFDDGELDWVFIDANHQFDFVMEDLIAWGRKVRSQGLITGHDWYRPKNNDVMHYGVIEAVTAYAGAHNYKPWFVLRGDDPKAASWMMVKQ